MDIAHLLQQTLTPQAISAISNQIGAQPQQVQAGISTAVPALIGGLARNTQTPQGAQTLGTALDRDHDGGLLDTVMGALGGGGGQGSGMGSALGGAGLASVLGGLMGGSGGMGSGGGMMGALGGLLGGRSANGAGILGHIFGGKQGAVEDGVSRASGLNRGQTVQLLMLLAPLLMSAIGKMKRQQGLDAQGVAGVLEQEEERATQPIPGVNKGGLMGMFDRDGDGSIADELAKLGAVVGGAYMFSQAQKRGGA